ncbi:hypothetical protein M0R45_001752 [Rubus argutus]|uniref:NAC domain-containing protein n=1 Tax=Rubus argutus TaxID=59490 RepID=A0AAW1VH83_RUBAR
MEERRGHQLPGERFCPMEDELVLLYLKPMLNGQKVPGRGRVVFDCDLYGHQEPWEIWETYKTRRPNDLRLNKDLYFFTQHKKVGLTDSRIRRTVGSGTWRADDSGKIVNSVETGLVVGLKKRYSYKNEASVHHGCWIMYEFELLDRSKKQKKNNDYVLCLLRKNGEPQSEKKRKQLPKKEVLGVNYVCDEGDNSNMEQEELLEPQARRQRTVQPIYNAPVVPIPSENENDAFAAELEESLPCFEDDNVPSDAETLGFQGEDNGGLDQLAAEVQSGHEENWGPSFGVDHGILNPLPENENDVFTDELEDLLSCFEDDNVPSEAEPNGFQGEQNGGLQQLADAMQSGLEENWPGLSFGDDLGILNPLPEEDFLWEEMVEEMGIVQMEELLLNGVSRNIDVGEENVSNNTLLPFLTQF